MMNEVNIYIAKSKERWPDYQWASARGKELLQAGLRRQLGDNKFVPNVKKRSDDKPYLKNSELYFNISHSRRYVICAISYEEVGIDIQYHRQKDLSAIAKRTMSTLEWEEYQQVNNSDKFFYDTWTMKESFLKYTGEGLRRDMRLLDIAAVVQEVAIDEKYSCMLCTKNQSIIKCFRL